MSKRLAPVAINALKEALCSIYWYKSELRSFLQNSLSDRSIVARADWNRHKREIVADIVDAICADQERHFRDLIRLCDDVCGMTTFKHLEALDDGAKKAERARAAVDSPRKPRAPSKSQEDEEQKIRRRQLEAAERIRSSQAMSAKLEEIRKTYMITLRQAPQERGYSLERILYDQDRRRANRWRIRT
jgi:hypothetical protein